ncbi:MAG: 6-phosphogluconolactonase [Lentimicrobium sp.]|jgi:6-phosphogluconolactonase|nr:6-phosphogluconolactonase [Lentimicrobium sp.]MDD2528591.1 6-phosphogluconolactonase [Lentimicrobiaceae bacterium]MDD4598338.1 6-phosphogluconolactonase [Lentimicrobiaceae bacterium]MDY0026118.1 6-phosphogluconolactonase [Lentimicrobium sp.]HAH56978.1 6-phosphogluconolactonase [Bacteroidales bacterium]
METTIKVFNNIDELSFYFGKLLKQGVDELPEDQTFSLALSGGSTPKAVFNFLAQHFKEQVAWEKVLVFWGDERCVPPDDKESNYRMAKESLLSLVPIPELNIFRIRGENIPHTEASAYEEKVKQNVYRVDKMPVFDLFMLGMGDDGHTVSIFPDHPELFRSDKLFEVAVHPESGQQRITATGKLINHARNVVFLVTGEAKSSMVATILEKGKGWEKLPAAMVHPEKGTLYWLLDEEAASKLDENSSS